MATFNYTNLHIFNKNGYEIPINYTGGLNISVSNSFGEHAEILAVTDTDCTVTDMFIKNPGARFSGLDASGALVDCIVTTPDGKQYSEKLRVDTSTHIAYPENYQYIKSVDASSVLMWDDIDASCYVFPSVTFSANLPFDKVSTELVETESLYVLVDDNGTIKLPNQYQPAIEWAEKFSLLFFIDNREQKDFRMFRVNNDSLVWSDRTIIDLADENEAHIGFVGENEGVYEQSMYMCIIDKSDNEIYPVGEFSMNIETVGEDERYRTLFTNFGIPDPKDYMDVFKSSISSLEEKTDNIELNKCSKRVFLTYSEIFPYVGTYKALINAVDMLGYDDIFFKEWYKDISKENGYENGYVAYDVDYKSDSHASTISNVSIEERIHLRKLNWLSMMYHLNKEIYDTAEDMWGFPTVIDNSKYYSPDVIAKLISLRKWLEKYVVGVHCRIISVGGEGVYFERYKQNTYATHQQVIDYENIKNVSPYITTPVLSLKNHEAVIEVEVDNYASGATLEDLSGKTLLDFCDGYLDASGIYRISDASIPDDASLVDSSLALVYIGETLELSDNENVYEAKATTVTDGFRFGNDASGFISSGPSILVDEGRVFLMPSDIANGMIHTATFSKLPIIELEEATLKICNNGKLADAYSIERDYRKNTSNTFIFKKYDSSGNVIFSKRTSDVLKLMPGDTSAGLKMSDANPYHDPRFAISGYTSINAMNDASMSIELDEYFLDIFDGKFAFNDPDNNRRIYLNFNGDTVTGEQGIDVDMSYYGNRYILFKYYDSDSSTAVPFPRFQPGKSYMGFRALYDSSVDAAVKYDPTVSVTVHNAGKFNVDVTCYDAYNNMFAATSPNTALVVTPEADMNILSDIESDTISDASLTSEFRGNDDLCIFEYMPKSTVVAAKDSSVSVKSFTNYYGIDDISGTTQFSNTGHRFNYVDVNDGVYSFTKDNVDVPLLMVTKNDVVNMLSKYDVSVYASSTPSELITELDGKITSLIDTEFDINFVVYDDAAECAIIQYPARMFEWTDGNYYVKFMNIVTSGDLQVLDEKLSSARYSVYIQPTWMTQVVVKQVTSIGDSSVIRCEYNDAAHAFSTPLNGNDISRLTFKHKTYQTESAGAVYENCETQGINNLYFYGKMDPRYVGENWTPIYEEISDPENYDVINGELVDASGNVVYVLDSSVAVAANRIGSSIYAGLYYMDTLGNPIQIFDSTQSRQNAMLYLSYAHLAYANYTVENTVNTKTADKNIIDLPETQQNDTIISHLDTTFSATTREFDTENSELYWMDDDDYENLAEETMYCHSGGIVNDGESNIICIPVINEIFGEDASCGVDVFPRWKVYKRTSENFSELLFDVFNSKLFINTFDKGIYDIELMLYDKYGNKYKKTFIGALTVK